MSIRLFLRISCVAILVSCFAIEAFGGDDASGQIHYSVDLSQPFSAYTFSERDRSWSDSLVRKLKYKGKVIHFVRISLPLSVANTVVQGAVYQAMEKPEYFYVVNGDAMLRLDARWAYNPGVAGFSMHAPKSRNFIVCLNLDGGVPFLTSSRVLKGKVSWMGHDWNRLKSP
ncbi:MAG: hypothetical protein JWO20_3290 [Candidatus Angelobacter sp.]|jgi:hypothetical protein|nr:hypothetical protein [Candidatus Angelobacter sp.]